MLVGGDVNGFLWLDPPGSSVEMMPLSGANVTGDGSGFAPLNPLLAGESGLPGSGEGVGESTSWATERQGMLSIVKDKVDRLTNTILLA